jgi:catechol 2,3-dioxygenase-like lactoylglutathione lyase family enzyme
MFTHVMVGANDLAASKKFYDAVLCALGLPRAKPIRRAASFIARRLACSASPSLSTASQRRTPMAVPSASRAPALSRRGLSVSPKPVRTSETPKEMLRFDLENENETIKHYRERVRQCEALSEYAMAEQIRQILVDEQDHQIDLATALGVEVPDVSSLRSK